MRGRLSACRRGRRRGNRHDKSPKSGAAAGSRRVARQVRRPRTRPPSAAIGRPCSRLLSAPFAWPSPRRFALARSTHAQRADARKSVLRRSAHTGAESHGRSCVLMAHASWLAPHGSWLMHTSTVRGMGEGGTIWRGRGSHGAADHVGRPRRPPHRLGKRRRSATMHGRAGGPRRPPNRLGYRRLSQTVHGRAGALSRAAAGVHSPGVRGVVAALWAPLIVPLLAWLSAMPVACVRPVACGHASCLRSTRVACRSRASSIS